MRMTSSKFSRNASPVRKALFACIAWGIFSNAAHAQSTQSYSVSVSNGGTLSYQVVTSGYTICNQNPLAYWKTIDFQNFVYTDSTGTKHSMSGGFDWREVDGPGGSTSDSQPVPGCPMPEPGGRTSDTQSFTLSPGDNSGYYVSATLPYGVGSPGQLNGTESFSLYGFAKLKYQILGVDYAPPGSKSNVTYGGSMMRGTSHSDSSSWTNNLSTSIGVSVKTGFLGIVDAAVSYTASASYAQEGDSSNSITVSTTKNVTDVIPGPASAATGISHDYDVIWVWLNPELNLNFTGPDSMQWNGYAYDPADDANEMEVVPLTVAELKNPTLIPIGTVARLNRSWDKSGLGALTTADYADILEADPFVANPSFNPNTDPNHRFDLQNGETFSYTPASPGGQPITQTYSISTQTTTSQGQGASDTHSVGLAIDDTLSGGIFGTKVTASLKISNTYTTTNKWSNLLNGGSGQTASLSITGPASTDGYTGPTTIQVWRDNVYGSFMFYGIQ